MIEGAYHGNTEQLVNISPYKFEGKGGHQQLNWVHQALLPCQYRGQFSSGEKYAESVLEKC